MNAVNYITNHPERIVSYALIAGGIGDIVPMAELMARDTRPPEARPNIMQFDGTPESMRTMMAAIILDPTKITDDLVTMRTAAANRHAEYFNRRMTSMFGGGDPNRSARMSTRGRFDRLTIPGIYLYGTEDVLMRHDVAGYPQEDALPDVQFFYPEDTGHQGQTDQPELFNQVFLEFFRDGKVSRGTALRAGMSTRRPPNPALVADA
jgi:pimeloyl-ACP methyl ester carboxylesterase